MLRVTITISLKEGVLDPEGQAIAHSLGNLGYHEAGDIRTGRIISLTMDESNHARANQKVAKMCETLLVNTVIENYDIAIEDQAEDE